MLSLESDEMTVFRPHQISTFPFHETFSNSIPKFFDLIHSLESDKMTALWPNDSLTFTFR